MAFPNTEPIFIIEPVHRVVNLTTQVLARDGVVAAFAPVLLLTAGESGALVESVSCHALGNVTANVLRLYLKAAAATKYELFRELALPAAAGTTDAAPIAGYPVSFVLPTILLPGSSATGIRLSAGVVLAVALGTSNAVGWNVSVTGGQYATS